MKKSWVLAAAAALLTRAAGAAPATPPSGVYAVEPNHTVVMFSLNHLGFTTYYGRFSGASGRLMLDAANPAASHIDISVPVGGAITPSDKLNETVVSAELLDAVKFPVMTFRSTGIVRTGVDTADVVGNLTLHGVTRPLVLKAKLHGFGLHPRENKMVVGFDATGQIKRSDFGVSAGVPLIGDVVSLTLSAEFDKVAS